MEESVDVQGDHKLRLKSGIYIGMSEIFSSGFLSHLRLGTTFALS